jgi:hypothetical protein
MVRPPDPMGRRWERSRSRRSSEHQERSNALWRERFPRSPDAPSSVVFSITDPRQVSRGPDFPNSFRCLGNRVVSTLFSRAACVSTAGKITTDLAPPVNYIRQFAADEDISRL